MQSEKKDYLDWPYLEQVFNLNNLVLALIVRQGYTHIPDARRRYAAHPLEALQLIFQQP